MTLQTSGVISIANIATELGISATGLSLNDSRCRGLAGVPSGALSLYNFYGKSSTFTAVNNPLPGNGGTYSDTETGTTTVTVTFRPDGTFAFGGSGSGITNTYNWASGSGSGTGWQVRFTLGANSGPGGNSPSTGWLPLSSNQFVNTTATSRTSPGSNIRSCTYLVEISKVSNSVVLASGSFTLRATSQFGV